MISLFQVWDLDTLQCVMTLKGHSGAVTSLICWDKFLLSCSLDCTIKVWAATERGSLEETYTHSEEHVCYSIFNPFPFCYVLSVIIVF